MADVATLKTPELADVLDARRLIAPYVDPTPLRRYPLLDEALDAEAFLKHENHLPTGAFKVRGGINLVGQLEPDLRAAGVCAASTGNHGQSVAYAAQPVRRRRHDLRPGWRKPREGGRDAVAGRGGGRRTARLRRGARALCGGGRRDGRSLHPLGRRAAADRRRRDCDAGGARARAGDRDDHRAGRRRQRCGRRLHRGQGRSAKASR